MRKIWSFRNMTNFAITVLGTSGLGLYFYQVYNQQKFNHPIINQAIKKLVQDQKIKELAGYPLSYRGSLNNTRIQKGDQVYYSFQAVGPRATIDIQMNTSSVLAKKFGQKTKNLLQQIKQVESDLSNIKNQISKQKDKDNKKLLLIQQKTKQAELAFKKQQIKNQIKIDKNKQQRFYVPDKNVYGDIIGNKITQIPSDMKLWGIQSLVVSLPNRTKLTIYDSEIQKKKILSEQDQNLLQKNQKPKEFKLQQIKPVQIKQSSQIKQKLMKNISIAQGEIQEYSKHKTQYMYQKYGTYRLMITFSAVIGAGLFIVFIFRHRHKSIAGGVLLIQTQKQFLKHPKIVQLMKDLNINKLTFNHKLIGGGLQGNYLNCQVDVQGIVGGKVMIQGYYVPKTQSYKFQKYVFQYRDKDNKKARVDLLT